MGRGRHDSCPGRATLARAAKRAFWDLGGEAACVYLSGHRERPRARRADPSAGLSSRATALPTCPVEVVRAGPSSSPSCLKRPQEVAG